MTRWVYATFLIALIVSWLSACGSSEHETTSLRATSNPSPYIVSSRGYVPGDYDGDDRPSEFTDKDDYQVRGYGRPAGAAALTAVTQLVKRYFSAAWVADGTRACSLMYQSLASRRDLTNEVPPDYASPMTEALRGPCARFMTALFRLSHQQFVAAALPDVFVTGLRIEGARGLVLLGFRTAPESQIAVRRVRGEWTIDGLLDSAMP